MRSPTTVPGRIETSLERKGLGVEKADGPTGVSQICRKVRGSVVWRPEPRVEDGVRHGAPVIVTRRSKGVRRYGVNTRFPDDTPSLRVCFFCVECPNALNAHPPGWVDQYRLGTLFILRDGTGRGRWVGSQVSKVLIHNPVHSERK